MIAPFNSNCDRSHLLRLLLWHRLRVHFSWLKALCALNKRQRLLLLLWLLSFNVLSKGYINLCLTCVWWIHLLLLWLNLRHYTNANSRSSALILNRIFIDWLSFDLSFDVSLQLSITVSFNLLIYALSILTVFCFLYSKLWLLVSTFGVSDFLGRSYLWNLFLRCFCYQLVSWGTRIALFLLVGCLFLSFCLFNYLFWI